MTTSTTTQTAQTTVADLLTQTTVAGSELVQQAPVVEVSSTLADKASAAAQAVKTASGAGLNFIQEHKSATIAAAGVVVVAGAGYAAYKWYKGRKASKKA